MALGDSFTFGSGLTPEQTIPKTLEALLNEAGLTKRISVINAGMGGYAPWQERGFLQDRGLEFDPDLVILQLFPGNDVDGTLDRTGELLRTFLVEWKKRVAQFRNWNRWRVRAHRWLLCYSSAYCVVVKATDGDVSLLSLVDALRFVPRTKKTHLPEPEPRSWTQEVNLVEWYPELERAWQMFLDDIEGTRDNCAERDVDFVVYCVPEMSTVIPEKWSTFVASTEGRWAYERGKAIRLVAEFCAEEGIACIDLLPYLQAQSDLPALYYMNDGHLAVAGARATAECIKDFLMGRYFPGKGLVVSAVDGNVQPSASMHPAP